MTDLKAEGVMLILRVMELVLKAFPAEGPHVFMSMLPSVLQAMLEGEVSLQQGREFMFMLPFVLQAMLEREVSLQQGR